jgi:putative ABC transport system substrate-binding protein
MWSGTLMPTDQALRGSMKRREFLGVIGGGLAWPVVARAQQQRPLIGFLSSRSPEDSKPHLAGFLRGLEAFGYLDGKTATIEYRWAKGQYDLLPKLAAELTALRPAVIAAPGGSPSAHAAKAATSSIPVFFVAADTVSEGLVASLSRPGGNVTGVDIMSGELTGKRLELLAQLVPAGEAIAFLMHPSGSQTASRLADAERAAQALGRKLIVVYARDDSELDQVLSSQLKTRAAGLLVENDASFDSRRAHIIARTAELAMPAIYHIRDFPVGGGLMSYGANLVDAYNQMGIQVGRVLKGANVADLPVIRPTKFELTLNLGTAKALRLVIPPNLLAIADEVID